MHKTNIPASILAKFKEGVVIPAHPLSLRDDYSIDVNDMKALANYYIEAGVGGIAIGVHTTQFEIRDPEHDLLEDVLSLTSKTIDQICEDKKKEIMKISGVCGSTKQAVAEAKLAASLGFHASLLSSTALKDASVDELIEHCEAVSAEIPIIGFYLQPAVGGMKLTYDFWKRFVQIDNVIGIKMAPFNRYQTIDVVRALCDAKRENEITLYTGNDDNIVVDLLTPYRFTRDGEVVEIRINGGLLGHWCCWTSKAVELLEEIHRIVERGETIPVEMLARNIEVTDANGVLFDVAHDFAGCIPGVHEVLRRQGLMKSTRCLNPHENLSAGQSAEIDRIYRMYSHLTDDDFAKRTLQ